MKDIEDSRLEFWNSRANLGLAAGSNDVNLKMLEMDNLCAHIKEAIDVLDAGCGNGATATKILQAFPDIILSAFDYSDEMVKATEKLAKEAGVSERLSVQTGDLLSPPFSGQKFDIIYTERSLINLDSFDAQMLAISRLSDRLKPDGRIVLCESFIDGLNEINSFRGPLGLGLIEPPWHNNYFDMDRLVKGLPSHLRIEAVDNFSSTYYFISRVVNAWLALQRGSDPSYDDPINKISFVLPSINVCAQTKIVIICKNESS